MHDNVLRLSNVPMDCSAKMKWSSLEIPQLMQLKRWPNVTALLYSDSVGLPTCSTMHGVYRVARNALPWWGTRRSLPPKHGLGLEVMRTIRHHTVKHHKTSSKKHKHRKMLETYSKCKHQVGSTSISGGISHLFLHVMAILNEALFDAAKFQSAEAFPENE